MCKLFTEIIITSESDEYPTPNTHENECYAEIGCEDNILFQRGFATNPVAAAAAAAEPVNPFDVSNGPQPDWLEVEAFELKELDSGVESEGCTISQVSVLACAGSEGEPEAGHL